MIASPIVPGQTYRVRGLGLDRVFPASNGAHALVLALDLLLNHPKE